MVLEPLVWVPDLLNGAIRAVWPVSAEAFRRESFKPWSCRLESRNDWHLETGSLIDDGDFLSREDYIGSLKVWCPRQDLNLYDVTH